MFIKICQWVVKIKNANKGEEVKIQKNVLTPFIDGPRTKFPDTFKGQLISKCLYEIIVWTKMPTKILIVSARAEIIKFFVGILVQTKTSKRHFEINRPLVILISYTKMS